MKKSIITLMLISIFAFVVSFGIVGCKKADQPADEQKMEQADESAPADAEKKEEATEEAAK